MTQPNCSEIQSSITQLRSKLNDLITKGRELQQKGFTETDIQLRSILIDISITKNKIKDKENGLKLCTQIENLRKKDPIEVAKQKAITNNTLKKADETRATLEAAGQQGTAAWNRATSIANSSQEKLNQLADPRTALDAAKNLSPIKELPIQPDPELLKKQAIAEAQKIRSQAEQMLQQKKEEEIAKLKDKVEKSAAPFAPLVGLFLKLPIADPKFLAQLTYEKGKQKIRELKQKASKENLKKSKEAFTFPMKPPVRLELGQVPQVPEIPKIPEIPTSTSVNNNPPTSPQPTSPIKSKFSFELDGGGNEGFQLIIVRYNGNRLNITSWPIRTRFSPVYGYSANGKIYPEGLPSVRAYIQDEISQGVFDRFVSSPF
jgi:hypothetical protein